MTDFDISVPQYQDESVGDGLIRMQWLNGEPKLRTGGMFFVPTERLPDGYEPGDPWEPYTHTFESGDKAQGFKADVLNLIFLCARQQPYLRSDGGKTKTWLTKWASGASMQAEALVIVEGMEDLGPVVWSSSTIKTSFAITARGDTKNPAGIIPRIRKELVKPAADKAKRPLDTYCFRVPVGTERNGAKIVYTRIEQHNVNVTRPVLLIPENPDIPTIRKFWAGSEYIQETLVPMREQYEEWRNERRINDEDEAMPASKPGRNAPQPLEEEEEDLF